MCLWPTRLKLYPHRKRILDSAISDCIFQNVYYSETERNSKVSMERHGIHDDGAQTGSQAYDGWRA